MTAKHAAVCSVRGPAVGTMIYKNDLYQSSYGKEVNKHLLIQRTRVLCLVPS